MDQSSNENETLVARIQELERERDELHKDVEQLCMQQAGPGYLGVATRMYFQRTAGMEQEIENLKKKLAASTRENINLREELSEAYHVKGQLADLHNAEVAKNIEAEKQLKFFQGCVAAAFAERDNAIMEAEKAKEKEELIPQKLLDAQTRIEELMSEILEEKEITKKLQSDLEKHEQQNKIFRKVIDKFYDIRENAESDSEDVSSEDKCECLLHDSADLWSFNDQEETSVSKYVNALEEEVQKLRSSMDNLQYQLRVGVQIENHLQKRIRDMEKEKIVSEKRIKKRISALHDYHSQHRTNIMNILDEGYSFMKSTVDVVEDKIRQFENGRVQELRSPQLEEPELPQNECRDVHISPDAGSDLITKKNEPSLATRLTEEYGDATEVLAQAMQEKVEALVLLSQQEERHLLERNVHAALQKKMEELQRNLLQVTNEKVKVLMELAQLKQDYHLLQEKVSQEMKQGNSLAQSGEKGIVQERDGRLRNILKNSYLKRWVGSVGSDGSNAASTYTMDHARMRIENATLKESLESMEHLTSSVRRLHLSLSKVKESAATKVTKTSMLDALDRIMSEAKLVRTALSSSLPISWSAEADGGISGPHHAEEINDDGADTSGEKIDFVSAAGFEMVELLIFAAQVLKDNINSEGRADLS